MVTLKRVIPQGEYIPRWVGVLSRDEYVTQAEAAFLLGIKPPSVRRLLEVGLLPYVVVCAERAIRIQAIAKLKRDGYTGKKGRQPRETCKRGHLWAEHRMPSGNCRLCARLSVRRRRGVMHQRVWP